MSLFFNADESSPRARRLSICCWSFGCCCTDGVARRRRRQEDRVDTVIGWPPQPTRVLNSRERVAYEHALAGAARSHRARAGAGLTVSQRAETKLLCRLAAAPRLPVRGFRGLRQGLEGHRRGRAQAGRRAGQRAAAIKRAKRMKRVLEGGWHPVDGVGRNIPCRHPSWCAMRSCRRPLPSVTPARGRDRRRPSRSAADATEPMAAGATVNPFDGFAPDSSQDLTVEYLDPSSSTWFDDLDSATDAAAEALGARGSVRRNLPAQEGVVQVSKASANSLASKVCRSSSCSPTPMK